MTKSEQLTLTHFAAKHKHGFLVTGYQDDQVVVGVYEKDDSLGMLFSYHLCSTPADVAALAGAAQ